MWIRKNDNEVVNLETGHRVLVTPVDDQRGRRTWEIRSIHPVGGNMLVMDGFSREEDAQKDVADFLDHNKIKEYEFTDPKVFVESENEAEDTQGSVPVTGKGGAK